MSIYVSLATENDSEIFYTIDDIFNKSSSPENIYVGLACMTTNSHYNEIIEKLSKYKNLKIQYFDPYENIGVGNGRNNALSMYNDEDYFLQIDSHTLFKQNWDTELISWLESAIKYTKNEKSIITSYLPPYKHTTEERSPIGTAPLYCFYNNLLFREPRKPMPRWDLLTLNPDTIGQKKYKKYIDGKDFIPAQKINAQFMFGNKHLAKNHSLSREIFFYEEETIQSIELLDKGFCFVWPNKLPPLCHLYGDDTNLPNSVSKRNADPVHDLWYKNAVNMSDFYYKYIKDNKNKNKCKRFEKYAGINLFKGAKRDKHYIPKKFNI